MIFRALSVIVTCGLFITTLACSDLSSQCANDHPSPGASCGNNGLGCPFTLQQPNCDGTFTAISTSCVCQQSAWSCPAAAVCDTGDASSE